jgi:hypothetical protein
MLAGIGAVVDRPSRPRLDLGTQLGIGASGLAVQEALGLENRVLERVRRMDDVPPPEELTAALTEHPQLPEQEALQDDQAEVPPVTQVPWDHPPPRREKLERYPAKMGDRLGTMPIRFRQRASKRKVFKEDADQTFVTM